jgi:hypothetical protein
MYTHYKSKAQLRLLCHSRRFAAAGGGEGCILLGAFFQSLFRGYKETRSIISFIPASSLPEMN